MSQSWNRPSKQWRSSCPNMAWLVSAPVIMVQVLDVYRAHALIAPRRSANWLPALRPARHSASGSSTTIHRITLGVSLGRASKASSAEDLLA